MSAAGNVRELRGRFVPGQSGNPSGRPKGAGKMAAIRQELAEHASVAVATLAKAAKAGDVDAAAVLLKFVLPPLKPVDAPAPVDLSGVDKPSEQVQKVLEAVAAGDVSTTQATELLTALQFGAKALGEAKSREKPRFLGG